MLLEARSPQSDQKWLFVPKHTSNWAIFPSIFKGFGLFPAILLKFRLFFYQNYDFGILMEFMARQSGSSGRLLRQIKNENTYLQQFLPSIYSRPQERYARSKGQVYFDLDLRHSMPFGQALVILQHFLSLNPALNHLSYQI